MRWTRAFCGKSEKLLFEHEMHLIALFIGDLVATDGLWERDCILNVLLQSINGLIPVLIRNMMPLLGGDGK
jgi:uncharacterized membrane protein YqaE (UPF0057 family)